MMPGLSVKDLPVIPTFRLDRVLGDKRGCETEVEARLEDERYRVPLLRRTGRLAKNPANRKAAHELADLLDYGDRDPPETPASKLYMRKMRELLIGNLSNFVLQHSIPVASVHLEPLRQELPGWCLNLLDPRAESDILRTALYGKGLGQLDGAAILFQDLEHEAGQDTWRGGRHGLVIGDKVAAFDALRTTRNYEPRLQDGNERRTSRVRIIRSISNLEYHLTYLFKGSIYGRWDGLIDGRRVRSGKKRIRGYRHSQALLWLHSHSVNDLCQLIGMRVGRDGFSFTDQQSGWRREPYTPL